MGKINIVKLVCDFCDYTDSFDIAMDPAKVVAKLEKWHGVMNGASQTNGAQDPHKWYDTPSCVVSGLKHDAIQAAADRELAQKVNAENVAKPVPQLEKDGPTVTDLVNKKKVTLQ